VPEPPGTEPGGTLPIFQSVEADYLHTRGRDLVRPGAGPTSAGLAPAGLIPAGPASAGLTSAGLPQRIPQANLAPGAAVGRAAQPATAAESARIALGRLSSFQRGSRRAREVARMDRDPDQSAQDD
jgi:hypothetical protein